MLEKERNINPWPCCTPPRLTARMEQDDRKYNQSLESGTTPAGMTIWQARYASNDLGMLTRRICWLTGYASKSTLGARKIWAPCMQKGEVFIASSDM